MPVRKLPPNPDLAHLKYQARDLLKDHARRDPAAAQRLREFHPRFRQSPDDEIFNAPLKLADAQLAIARESGFQSWTRLKRRVEQPTPSDRLDLRHHERIKDSIFRHAVDLIDAGDAAGLRAYLRAHPGLVHQHVVFEGMNYFHNPTLLEFIAENPVRRGTMPKNIVEVAKVILDAGAGRDKTELNQTLMLVATGSVARECRQQTLLIDLLCDRGADPGSAIEIAAVLGEIESLRALIQRGARVTLPIAAALGGVDEFRRQLPEASAEERHLALAIAADYGQIEVMRMLLDAGEDPNRYNPVGGHSHTTPLHQAAMHGNEEMVRLLVGRGARLDIRDVLWHATPADWAKHEGNAKVEAYLRSLERESR
ncbi:MAG: ankyrin repeat domain-containing protein [Terriglobales bacterium]